HDATAYVTAKFACVRIVGWNTVVGTPAIGAISGSHPNLEDERFAGVERFMVSLQAAAAILWMYCVSPGLAKLLLEGAPGKLQPTFVDVNAVLVGTGRPNGDVGSVSGHAFYYAVDDLPVEIVSEPRSRELGSIRPIFQHSQISAKVPDA